jgi:hypothetical protein
VTRVSDRRFIARVTYKGNRRVARTYVKLQYGAVFTLSETLSRAWAIGLIDWFRIDTIKPNEITPEIRASLQRWPQALEATTERTKVAFGG